MPIIDTHTHIATGANPRYPLSSSDLTHEWWDSGGTVDELLDVLDASDVERVVFVQAIAAYGYDCSYVIDSAEAHAERATCVVAIDMFGPDPVSDLGALVASPQSGARIAGVRLFGVNGSSPIWLTDGRASEVWEFAATHGIILVPTLFASEFESLRAVVERHPTVSVAIDHCGFIDMVDDGEKMLFALADVPSVNLKVTSYVLEAAERTETDAAVLIERLASSFGSHRLCWGSDHPQDTRHDYTGKLALARSATRSFSEADRTAFFHDTGARLFFPE